MTERSWTLDMVAPLEPGIVCTDIERMLAFYRDVLGFELVGDAEATSEMSTHFGATPLGYRVVRLQTPYGERIKFIQTKVPPEAAPLPRWVFERHGFTYLTFIVADIEALFGRLRTHNVRMITLRPIEVRKGFLALFVTDPEGNYLEFVQYADVASYRSDLVPREPKHEVITRSDQ